MKFKEFMTQNDRIYRKLTIFDFDDTLVFTPHPAEGRKAYQEATGEEWPWQKGWWDCNLSLQPPVMPKPAPIRYLNQDVASEAYKAIREPSTFVVVMTGRKETLKSEVARILDDYSIKPDELILRPSGAKTVTFKLQKIREFIERFPALEEVHVWDDKGAKRAKMNEDPEENHIAAFKQLGNKLTELKLNEQPNSKFKFKVNEVVSPSVAAFEAQQKAIKEAEEEKKRKFGI